MYIRVNSRDNVAILVHPEGAAPGELLPDGLVARERIPQSHKIALQDLERRRTGTALRADHRPRQPRHRRRQLGARGTARHARRAAARRAPAGDRCPARAAAAGRLHLRGLPQCRWRHRHQEHPGARHHRAMRRAHRGIRCAAHTDGDSAALPECGWRCRHHPFLRLRRGHRCARRRGAHPHAEAHRTARQSRGAAAAGQPGMRETAAHAALRQRPADSWARAT